MGLWLTSYLPTSLQIFYLVGFGLFCLESLLSCWVLQVRTALMLSLFLLVAVNSMFLSWLCVSFLRKIAKNMLVDYAKLFQPKGNMLFKFLYLIQLMDILGPHFQCLESYLHISVDALFMDEFIVRIHVCIYSHCIHLIVCLCRKSTCISEGTNEEKGLWMVPCRVMSFF